MDPSGIEDWFELALDLPEKRRERMLTDLARKDPATAEAVRSLLQGMIKNPDFACQTGRGGWSAKWAPPGPPLHVAIIGAGLAGLTCARQLRGHGLKVSLFDKGRGPGGRMSTRRTADGDAFDHGAQYFTARDPNFADEVAAWVAAGAAAEWHGRIAELEAGRSTAVPTTPRFVGVPRMSAILRHLSGEEVQFGRRVAQIERTGRRFTLTFTDAEPIDGIDAVVVAAPAPQTEQLLQPVAPDLAARAAQAELAPCWAVMLTFATRLPIKFDGAFVADSPLAWIARNNSKPGRDATECWVLHGSPEWSQDRFDATPAAVIQELSAALAEATGEVLPAATTATAHRWAYAQAVGVLNEPYLFDDDLRIGACGDWCVAPRVEGAYQSGAALAARLLVRTRRAGR
ncbi:MAG: FAD-dependent oxidoreductase [Planctomycetota bacterium]